MKKTVALVLANLAWLAFIFSNSLKNRVDSADQSEAAEGFLRRILSALGFSGNTEAVAEIAVRKAAHIFEFFVLCFLMYLLVSQLCGQHRKACLLAAIVSVLAAAVDESLQLISNRGASVKDVLIDSVGVVIALALVALVRRIKQSKA
ncbi:MAG: VanZ family protein [Clostridia bacterium]|nr:VanZ family protein [Clostridia bacterium]